MELTFRAIILGILLSLLLGAANAYLGLKVGMTVSASIPAAVLSFAILRYFRQAGILENNLVQTAASAGESLAAGMIFTLPALILLGVWQDFDYLQGTLLITLGGILGVLIAVPLRTAMIGSDTRPGLAELRFPEGIATAEVLKAGYHDRTAGRTLLLAGLLAAGIKLLQSGFGLAATSVTLAYQHSRTLFGFGMELSPALIAVGYIVGLRVAGLMFIGGVFIWLVIMPIYAGLHPVVDESTSAMANAFTLWSTRLRFIGVGAMLIAGFWVLILAIRPVWQSMQRTWAHSTSSAHHNREFSLRYSLLGMLLLCGPLGLVLYLLSGQILLVVSGVVFALLAGFLFSMVAAYMAGLVGSSNNPISGVTIATLFMAALLLYPLLPSHDDQARTLAAGLTIMIGAIVCCAAAISGDTMQDLKAGQLVGATPRYQTWMQLVGVVSAGVILIPVLHLLYEAYGFVGFFPRADMPASQALAAPQASLMKSVVLGVFGQQLDWPLLLTGMISALLIIIIDLVLKYRQSTLRLPVMAVAVGMYLPVTLSVPVFIGGLIAQQLQRRHPQARQQATLYSAGLIAGEALLGVLLAIPFAILQDSTVLFVVGPPDSLWNTFFALGLLGYVCYRLYRVAREAVDA